MEQKQQNFALKLILSIIMIFLSPLFGILALIFTLMANGSFKSSDFESGMKKAKGATICLIIGAVELFLRVIAIILIIVFGGAASILAAAGLSDAIDDYDLSTEYSSNEPSNEDADNDEEMLNGDSIVYDGSYTNSGYLVNNTIYDYMFCLDDMVYALPCNASDFSDNGWLIHNYGEETVVAPGEDVYVGLEKGDMSVAVTLSNPYTTEDIALEDSLVTSISISGYNGTDAASTYIANGIHIGSSYDDVIACYGEPTEVNEVEGYEEEAYTYVTYLVDPDDYYASTTIYFTDDFIDNIIISNH